MQGSTNVVPASHSPLPVTTQADYTHCVGLAVEMNTGSATGKRLSACCPAAVPMSCSNHSSWCWARHRNEHRLHNWAAFECTYAVRLHPVPASVMFILPVVLYVQASWNIELLGEPVCVCVCLILDQKCARTTDPVVFYTIFLECIFLLKQSAHTKCAWGQLWG